MKHLIDLLKKNQKKFVTTLVIAGVISVIPLSKIMTEPDEKVQLLNSIVTNLSNYHYSPQLVNDNFSKKVFDLFIKRIDFNKQFLTQEDINQLKKYETLIDDEVKNYSFEFFNLATALLDKRIREVQIEYRKYLEKPFVYTADEYLELDGEKREFAKDKAELLDRWRKLIKHQVISNYITAEKEAAKEAGKEGTPGLEKGIDPKLEKEAREKTAASLERTFERLLQENKQDKTDLYFDTIANTYDPHTGYFPPQKKEDFDISIRGTLEGIGAVLREDEGYIKVVEVVPGSAAWRQKELKVGDLILKVGQGNEVPVDVVGARVQDAVRLIRGKKGTEVRLTVKKHDGAITVIPIVRDVVVIEETYAKSSVIENTKLHRRFGYIQLPSFYRDFANTNSRNSSADVARLIGELKKQRIEGLILDLRNNGGGALEDAITMAGLFINQGPVVQIQNGSQQTWVYPDTDPRVQYDGPLVVLVNTLSASASEILSAALQDYGRAVIIGSPHTFGKGTVQRFINLDNTFVRNFGNTDDSDFGSLKLTIQKFYRVNGDSTQYKGVEPDVVLPDVLNPEIGEKTLDYSLPWTSIKELDYRKWQHPLFINKIVQKSNERISKSPAFSIIKENMERLDRQREDTLQPLNLAKFRTQQNTLKEETDRYNAAFKEIEHLVLTEVSKQAPPSTSQPSEADQARLEKLEDWHEQLKKDVYLEEATYILNDLIDETVTYYNNSNRR